MFKNLMNLGPMKGPLAIVGVAFLGIYALWWVGYGVLSIISALS